MNTVQQTVTVTLHAFSMHMVEVHVAAGHLALDGGNVPKALFHLSEAKEWFALAFQIIPRTHDTP